MLRRYVQHLVVTLVFSSIRTALSATCSDGTFGGCDRIKGLCWEDRLRNTTFCTCKAGYTFSTCKKGRCRDINECATGMHSCNTENGRCVNEKGSYRCECNAGYELDFTKTKCLLSSKISGRCRNHHDIHTRFLDRQRNLFRYQPQFAREATKLRLLRYFLRSTVTKKTSENEDSCKCEAGFEKCNANLCKDVDECKEGSSKCDLQNGNCHNSIGGYFCSCNTGYVLGPCGYKCYNKTEQRPTECTSNNSMASSLVRSDSNGFNDEAHLALVHDVMTERAATRRNFLALETLRGKKCSGSQLKTQRFDLNDDGRMDIIAKFHCVARRYRVLSISNTEGSWDQWTCWTECKATCHGGIQTRTRYCKNGLVGEGACRGSATEYKTCYSGRKCELRIRKNANTLTEDERKDLIQAFRKYKNDSSTNGYWAAAGTHVFPSQCFDQANGRQRGCCYHGAKMNFIMWHRAELLNFEEGLARYLKNRNLGLPYWDWLKDDEVPSLAWSKTLYGQPNPFANMTIRPDLPSKQGIQRSPTVDVNEIQQARDVFLNVAMDFMDSHTLHEFSDELEDAHNYIHTSICTAMGLECLYSMASLSYAGFDPIFFMHHANVDRQFTRLQREMEKKGEVAWTRQSALEPQESIYHFNEPYSPFSNETLTAFKTVRALSSMQDLFYHEELLGYKYDTLEMYGEKKTPTDEIVLDIIQYERSFESDLKITYYVEDHIDGHPRLPHCADVSESDPRFVGKVLILGTESEQSWENRKPTYIPMSDWVKRNTGQTETTNYHIRACYTHNISCTSHCTEIPSTLVRMIPSPQLMLRPKSGRSRLRKLHLFKFQWDSKVRMPNWDINLNAATQWIKFWGKEVHNVVQVPNRKSFSNCIAHKGHKVSCTGACILPTGNHYFIHTDRTQCENGLKLSILSQL